MKASVILLVLSAAVMAVMVGQVLRQELSLRQLKVHMVQSAEDVKTKERAIIQVRAKVDGIKKELQAVNIKMEELKKSKVAAEKSLQEHDKNLQACNTEKTETDKKKTDLREAIAKLTADHEDAKGKAEKIIQSLKQEILDRDKAICAFADTTKKEARVLCGLPEAEK
ncbi:hypothetical protein INR49_022808 [Caranx melampygus]|nr:hypothetical protein INR49_022808 [Caranx melampygus]